jgi:Protein of unknown function (DUF3429)
MGPSPGMVARVLQAPAGCLSNGAFTLTPLAEGVAYASIVPLVLCLLGVGLGSDYAERELAQRIAIAHGAVLLAFAGAVHWGLAMAGRLSWGPRRVAGAVLPAVAAATAVVLGGQRGLALLAVATGVFWLYEHHSIGPELPPAYLGLRRNLTLAGSTLLAITMILSENAGLP